MVLISIIVPVYNVEKYLEECIDSILAQTYREFELILVDDGSPDHSGEICDRYASQDKRIRVLHQENQGISDARNHALAVARGQYVTFVDSDDYIAPDMLELLYHNMKKENAQISICGTWFVYEKCSQKEGVGDTYLKMNAQEALEKIVDFGYFDESLCRKLFDVNLLQSIRFPSGVLAEDILVTPKIIARANCIVYDSSPKYYYRQRQGSITKGDAFEISYVNATKASTAFIAEQFPDLKEICQRKEMYVHLMVYTILLRGKDTKPQLDEFYQKVVEKVRALETPKIVKAFPIKARISLWLLLRSRLIHAIVYRIYWHFSLKP